MEKKDTIDHMDKLVKRVTVVRGSGENRHAEVVYESDDEEAEEEDREPNLKSLERSVRHILKAQLVAAQEAYQRHLDSVEKGGAAWMKDAPGNIWEAGSKAAKEIRKSMPFGRSDDDDEDEDEDKGKGKGKGKGKDKEV
jgi:hypothetical protein